MRNYLWISVVLVLAGFSSGFAKDLSCSSKDMTVKKFSLSKAVEKALEMNPEVKKAFYDTKAFKADYDNALSNFMPEISAYAEYLNGDAPSSYLFKSIDQRKLPPATDFNDPGSFENYEAGISAKMRLFNGNRTLNFKKMAEQGVLAGKFMEDEVKNSLIYSVISVWYDILNAKDMVNIAIDSVNAIEEQVRIKEIKFKGGSALESDLLSLRAGLYEAREKFLEAKNNCRIMRSRLAVIIGLDPMTEIDTSDDDFQIDKIPHTFISLSEKALELRPYLKAVKKQVLIETKKVKIEKGGYLPTLDLKMDYYHDDPDFKFSKERENYRVGVVMGLKIFDGFSTSSKIKKADAMLKKALEEERKAVLNVKMQIRKALFDFELAKEQFETAKLRKNDAEASFKLVKNQFEGGSADITRYLNAELAKNSAETAERLAYYRIKKARAAMAEASGFLYFFAKELK
ncbi:MAG: TolC family protein [Desulforegulaceae bacterium]|nr:TolC family protein [Desulforegulaceae bacterium]